LKEGKDVAYIRSSKFIKGSNEYLRTTKRGGVEAESAVKERGDGGKLDARLNKGRHKEGGQKGSA